MSATVRARTSPVSPTVPPRPAAGTGAAADAGEFRFALAITTLYSLVVAVGLAHHELWRDELQAWMLARDSASLAELAYNTRYEGHPLLWHGLLFVLSRFTRAPSAMQALHLIIASAHAYLVARYAPFTRLQRGLLVFGYFGAFEYAVVSRSYVLGALLLTAACAAYARRRSWLAAAMLVLLAQTSVFGVIIASAFAAALVAEQLPWRSSPDNRPRSEDVRAAVTTAALVAASGLTATLQMLPPADAAFGALAPKTAEAATPFAWMIPLVNVARAYFPVHDYSTWPSLWDSNALSYFVRRLDWRTTLGWTRSWLVVHGLASLACVAVTTAVVARRRIAVVFYSVATLGLLAFAGLRFAGYMRHYGHFFLGSVAALWLAYVVVGPAPGATPRPAVGPANLVRRLRSFAIGPAFTGLLVAHVVAAATAIASDLLYPFSGAKAAAALVHQRGLDTLPLIGVRRHHASAVSGYLDRPLYYVEDGRRGTFIVWGSVAQPRPSDSQVFDAVEGYLRRGASAVGIITNYDLGASPPDLIVTPLGRAAGIVLPDETYVIYRAVRAPATPRVLPSTSI